MTEREVVHSLLSGWPNTLIVPLEGYVNQGRRVACWPFDWFTSENI